MSSEERLIKGLQKQRNGRSTRSLARSVTMAGIIRHPGPYSRANSAAYTEMLDFPWDVALRSFLGCTMASGNNGHVRNDHDILDIFFNDANNI